MEKNIVPISMFVTCLLFATIIYFFVVKRKKGNVRVFFCITAIIGIVLIAVAYMGHDDTKEISDFHTFSANDMYDAASLLDKTLAVQNASHGTGSDFSEHNMLITSWDLHFMDKSFSNLQFSLINTSDISKEELYQVNQDGKLFLSTSHNSRSTDNTLVSVREFKSLLLLIDEAEIVDSIDTKDSAALNMTYHGLYQATLDDLDYSRSYIVKDNALVPLSATAETSERLENCLLFSLVSGSRELLIFYPVG